MTKLNPAVATRSPASSRKSKPAAPALSRREICVNCRILGGPVTGVQRYLGELLATLPGGLRSIRPPRPEHGLKGHLWEQATLPKEATGLLWSPSNTGPLRVRDQVVTIHDVASLDHPEWFRPSFAAWYRFLTPRLVRRVRRVIAVSEFSKSRIVEHSGVVPEKVVVIPNGISARFRPPVPEESARLGEKYPRLRGDYLLSVGSLEPRKNLDRLFQAWERVRLVAPGVTLAVAGTAGRVFSGTGFALFPPGVEALGYVDDRDLPALYGNALAFVYPSLYEGFGLPPLEAMACGTPVVVSDVPSLVESVGDAAIFFDPNDVKSIAEGLLTAISDRLLRDVLRRRGLERAGLFTWDQTAAKTWEVLRAATDEL
jgi:glycosyltransferase involved in cell wall biosynthesis